MVKKYVNIIHIRHKANIGGNANIVRALEYVSKKYFWILCDDDTIDFRYWNEILYGMKNNYDVILTERKIDIDSYRDYHLIVNTLAFVSDGIYKTENITDEVMTNAMINIQNGFPHLVLAISIINNRKKYIYLNIPYYSKILSLVLLEE